MEKSKTLNLRVNPVLKKDAEEVLSKLGLPMSTAIDLFLHQVVLTGGIPFSVSLSNSVEKMAIFNMTEEEFYAKLKRGYADYEEGKVQNAEKAFAKFRESHSS